MSEDVIARFDAAWTALARDLALEADLATACAQSVRTHYAEPHRHYHTLRHIVSLLEGARDLRDHFENWDAVRLAIVFHDVIYDVAKFDNEHQSALLLAEMLGEYIDGEVLIQAQRTIEATQRHVATPWSDTNLVIDLDMAIMGQPWPVYARYLEAVRAEYVPIYGEEMYRQGRMALFLEPTLQKPSIFLTAPFTALDDQAHANILRELSLLNTV
ncbi:HD domain-containing protein [Woodsholea maritima]|uniref:HD domain-containing protein n=1 Tax=Woodsholea maritima TaxID=240237 RepID=UPI00035C3361|nr:hypothetical protein [Woodsholea maritima]